MHTREVGRLRKLRQRVCRHKWEYLAAGVGPANFEVPNVSFKMRVCDKCYKVEILDEQYRCTKVEILDE